MAQRKRSLLHSAAVVAPFATHTLTACRALEQRMRDEQDESTVAAMAAMLAFIRSCTSAATRSTRGVYDQR